MFYGSQTFHNNFIVIECTPMAYYRMDGRRVEKPQRGLNIIRYPDGTVRKVIVK